MKGILRRPVVRVRGDVLLVLVLVSVPMGCVHSRVPGSCDVTAQLIDSYFGRSPQEQLGYEQAVESVIGSHAQFLCRAKEAPLHSIGQPRFVRCVWHRSFEDPVIVSLSDGCVAVSRRVVDAGGAHRVEDVQQALDKAECSKRLTAALVAARSGVGRSSLPPGMASVDGDMLFFEVREGEWRRAGAVDMPVLGPGATGAVQACVLVQEALTPGGT